MPGLRDMRVVVRLLFVLCLMSWAPASGAADSGSAQEQVQRQQDQPLNNAPVWRDVRGGDNRYQTTQVRGVETSVLVQPAGETWRQLRPVLALAGGLILVFVLAGLFGYYRWRGAIGLHDKPAGRKPIFRPPSSKNTAATAWPRASCRHAPRCARPRRCWAATAM